jgi:hypothetical protein
MLSRQPNGKHWPKIIQELPAYRRHIHSAVLRNDLPIAVWSEKAPEGPSFSCRSILLRAEPTYTGSVEDVA